MKIYILLFSCCLLRLPAIVLTESVIKFQSGSKNAGDLKNGGSSSARKFVYEIDSNSPSEEISKFVNLGLQNSESSDIPSKSFTRRDRLLDSEFRDQLDGNGWLDVIPGTPGKDYPNYKNIPETSFTCNEKSPGGYYADIEARCQVFHVCTTDGQKSSFICPSGSIFNQKYFVCDWWYDFECDDATDLYSLNEKVNRGGFGSGPGGPGRLLIEEEEEEKEEGEEKFEVRLHPGVENFFGGVFDLSLAGTGEGAVGYGGNQGYQSNVEMDKEEDEKDNRESFKKDCGKNPALTSEGISLINFDRKRFRKGSNAPYSGENLRDGNYRRQEGRDNFPTGNERHLQLNSYSSMKEILPEVNDGRNHRTESIPKQKRKPGTGSIAPGTRYRIKENRYRSRGDNYPGADYLIGVVTENGEPGNRSSNTDHSTQRRRFLPIL